MWRPRCSSCCSRTSSWFFVILAAAALNQTTPDEVIFASASPQSQGMDPAALQELADVVKGYVERGDALGGELLVIKNRRVVLHEAFGWRDREHDEPMAPNTIFNIRSMTKPLTGAAAQILIDRGKLKLDDPVAEYLPGFDTDASRGITVRHLLTHRSGLPLSIMIGKGIDAYDTLQDMANATGEEGPEFEIDSKFWYSDSGTDTLGAVVEVVSGRTIDEFVRENLLEPLGMDDSFYGYQPDEPRWDRTASLYGGAGGNWMKIWDPDDRKPFYPGYAWGSQSVYATPMDYAKFLAMWMDDGRAGEAQVLSPEAITRTLTPVSPMKSLGSDEPMPTFFPDLDPWYGQMAISYIEKGGSSDATPQVIGHSGSDGTAAWAWPERDLMVLYFTQSRGGLSVLNLEKEIDRLLIHPGREETAEAIPAELEPYLGTYVANFGPFRETEFTVLVQNGRLAVDVPGQMAFELKDPDDEGKRYFALTNQVAVSFDQDEAGAVIGMKMHQSGMTFDLPKGTAREIIDRPLDVEYARKCEGTYWSEEEQAEIKVFLHEGALALQPANVPIPLDLYTPDDSGLWTIKLDVSVKIRFDEDEQGNIVSFTAILPDGRELVRPRMAENDDEPDGG